MLALEHTDLTPLFLKDPLANDFFRCTNCADEFKREDHLRRHELSHRSPKFKCLQDGCGKLFHRNDVLKRHQLVHRPEPEKRRHTGRKRVMSKGKVGQKSPALQKPNENNMGSSIFSTQYLSGLQIYTTSTDPWAMTSPSLSDTSSAHILENAPLPSWSGRWSGSNTYIAPQNQSPGLLGSSLVCGLAPLYHTFFHSSNSIRCYTLNGPFR
jgi:hypothetical protein